MQIEVHDEDREQRQIVLAAIRTYLFFKKHESDLGAGGRHIMDDLRRALVGEVLQPLDDTDKFERRYEQTGYCNPRGHSSF